jgi:hypothetical protein
VGLSGIASLVGANASPGNQSIQQQLLFGSVTSSTPLQVTIDGASTPVSAKASLSDAGFCVVGARVLGVRVGGTFYVTEVWSSAAAPNFAVATWTATAHAAVASFANTAFTGGSLGAETIGGSLSARASGLNFLKKGVYSIEYTLNIASGVAANSRLQFGFALVAGTVLLPSVIPMKMPMNGHSFADMVTLTFVVPADGTNSVDFNFAADTTSGTVTPTVRVIKMGSGT